ncbi:hypothetical protein, variant [Saprolegnia diclina VS20]|uniref:Zinc transporter, ZIP family n=1 Tax=Saprolegnia diclina (strain VS20) TaxID=1156394 RepID=T0RBQ1_SAPDV|nr:hypothetical protein, variant [Saprolegnia diclina VS20]EQC29618.1 hypothetical protein, variant [Saprolegnia diclina VS20]|eukprot:XP_008616922.1 hypothetical protein, variant [Saprolegnia diclina VS20]
MPEITKEVGIAFALTWAAAFATCIGGLVIFSASMVKMANAKNLSIALALAGGVMVFISLVEIFNESVEQFKAGNADEAGECDSTCEGNAWVFTNICFAVGAGIIYLLDALVHRLSPDLKDEVDLADLARLEQVVDGHVALTTPTDADKEALAGKEKAAMNRTGVLTAIALAIHNLPEGIAVATPVYFATGNRCKAFWWACASSLAEPLGAILAFFILGDGLNPTVEGAMFGLVAGMMVTLSIKELIPSAVKFCPDGNAVSIAILGGMGIMSLSLILFAYVGV